MNLSHKLRLFWHTGRRILSGIAFVLVAFAIHVLLRPDSPDVEVYRLFRNLSAVALCVAVLVIWLKVRRGILAATTGERFEATVLDVRVHMRNDDGPDSYVLTWHDDDGSMGKSIPDRKEAFDGLKPGDRIFIFKNNAHDSWWERDIYGPLIRSSNGVDRT